MTEDKQCHFCTKTFASIETLTRHLIYDRCRASLESSRSTDSDNSDTVARAHSIRQALKQLTSS